MAGKKKGELEKAFALPKAPERSPVPEAEARKFERGRPLAPASKPSKLRRPDGDGTTRVSGYIRSENEEALRLRCAKDRRSISDALDEAVALWLSGTTAQKS